MLPGMHVAGNFSEAVGVDPFLVAFIITPLASNSSEVVSSLLFAGKKRKSSISLCYSQIYGAITMNNTLCLGIFLAIVHLRGLTWDFSAEVTAMVAVILATGAIGSSRQTFNLAWALPVAMLYPVSLAGRPLLWLGATCCPAAGSDSAGRLLHLAKHARCPSALPDRIPAAFVDRCGVP